MSERRSVWVRDHMELCSNLTTLNWYRTKTKTFTNENKVLSSLTTWFTSKYFLTFQQFWRKANAKTHNIFLPRIVSFLGFSIRIVFIQNYWIKKNVKFWTGKVMSVEHKRAKIQEPPLSRQRKQHCRRRWFHIFHSPRLTVSFFSLQLLALIRRMFFE